MYTPSEVFIFTSYPYCKIMKVSLYKSTAALLMVFVAVYALTIVVAQAETTVDVSATTEVQVSPSATKTPGLMIPPGTKPPLRTVIKNNIEQNKEVRNNMLEKKQEVRKDMKTEVKDIRSEAKGDIKEIRQDMRKDLPCVPPIALRAAGTTTAPATDAKPPCTPENAMQFKRDAKEVRKDIAKKMEIKTFEVRKNALVKELTLSLENMTSIAARIDSRIVKIEAEGRTMTEARALLVTANEKLAKAKADVAAFAALAAPTPAPSTSPTATAEVDLAKPRTVGDAAIKSVKEARDAFQKVVKAIGNNMGVKAGATVSPSASATN